LLDHEPAAGRSVQLNRDILGDAGALCRAINMAVDGLSDDGSPLMALASVVEEKLDDAVSLIEKVKASGVLREGA
jgi:hypothetical protein